MPKDPSKPKRSHNFTSCNRCRSKRRRCDGVAPSRATIEEPSRSCSSCIRQQQDCTWSGEPDHRLPPSHRLVESLQTTVGVLERKVLAYERRLRENGLSVDFEDGDDGFDANHSDVLSDGELSDVDGVTSSLGKLVVSSTATTYYGGPAPFRDLPNSEDLDKYQLMQSTSSAGPSHYDSSTMRYQLCKSSSEVHALDPQSASGWLLFLPGDTAQILSRLEHDLVLDKFFRFYSTWNCRVIPDLFLRDFALATSPKSSYHRAGVRPPLRHYSAVVHNAILCVALAYSDNVHLRSREIRDRFAKHAKFFLEAECNAPMLSTVQALAILSSYHSGLSEQGLGFMYFGMSIRMGQALGLNIWVRNGAMSQLDVVERNWVFWSIFCQDKCWSLYVGRDEGLRYRALDIPEPEVDPVPEWDYSMPEPNAPDGRTNPTLAFKASNMSISFLWQVKLMKIASSIMDVVYGMTGVARRGIDLAQVAQLHTDLRAWERSLPIQIRIAPNTLSTCSSPPEVFMLNMAFHWLLILLLYPFFKPHIKIQPPSSSEIPSGASSTKRRDFALLKLREAALNECPTSATYILSLFGAYRRLYTLRLTPVTAIQIAYTAGKTHLATILAGGPNPSAKARKAKGEFLECVQILKEIGESWTPGRLAADMLQALLLRGEKRMQQGLVAIPQAGVRLYDPPPYPPPARSGTAMVTPIINFSGVFGLAADGFQARSEGSLNLEHQSNPSTDRMGLPTSVPSDSRPPDDNPGGFNLWASRERQEQEQPTGSGGSSSPNSVSMPIPIHDSHHRLPPNGHDPSSSFGNVWSHTLFPSAPLGAPWMHDGQMFSDQPSSDTYTLSPWLAALQALPMDEDDPNEQHQPSDQDIVDHLDLLEGESAG